MTGPDATDAPIRSREDFRQAIRSAFHEAAAVGCRELWLCDRDFAAWPLGEPALVADLARWVDSRRRLHLLAAGFDAVARLHPRWVAWRLDWAHVVACRSQGEREPGDIPTLMIAPGHFSLWLADPIAFRGRMSRDGADALRARERLDAVLQQSVDAFPARVTGL